MSLTPEQKALATQDFAKITENEAKGAIDTAKTIITILKEPLERLLEG